MCQSLAEGGIRCSQSALKEKRNQTINHVQIVREEAAKEGIHISLASPSTLNDADWDYIKTATDNTPKVSKAIYAQITANRNWRSAIDATNTVKFAALVNDEKRAIEVLNLRNENYKEDLSKEELSAIEETSKKRLETIKEAIQTGDTDTIDKAVGKTTGLDKAREEYSNARQITQEAKEEVENHYTDLLQSQKTKVSREFTAYTKSESYKNNPRIAESIETNKKVERDLKLTKHYAQMLAKTKSYHPVGTWKWEKLDRQEKTLEVARSLRKYKNMVKALGSTHPNAKAQYQEYLSLSEKHSGSLKEDFKAKAQELRESLNA